MDMLGNEATRLNLRYLGGFDWGALEARLYHETVDHFMDFGPDKRYWYGTVSGGPTAPNGTPCSPIGTNCAAGMPMYTASTNSGAVLKADLQLTQQDLLRVGGEYQLYRLDDWWPPSGGGMWPGTFWNIRDGERERLGLFGEWEKKLSTQWQTLAGLRYERVAMDTGNVTGYNPGGGGNQGRDANAFNASNRKKTDHNWDWTLIARYTASPTQDIEFGYAHKTRSPNLHERYAWSTWSMAALMVNWVGDGNGYIGNLNPESVVAKTQTSSEAIRHDF